MKKRKEKKLLIIAVIILITTIAIFLFSYREIEKNIQQISQIETEFQQEFLKHNEVKILNNYFQSIKEEKVLLESHFVQSSDVVPFLNTLENLAKEIGVKTEVSSITIAKDDSGLILETKNNANFEQLYKFISLLENAPYEMEFLSVDIHNLIKSDENRGVLDSNGWEALIKLKLVSYT